MTAKTKNTRMQEIRDTSQTLDERLQEIRDASQNFRADLRAEHEGVQDKLSQKRAERQALASSLANPDEIVAVAEHAVQTMADQFEQRQREHGLAQLTASVATDLASTPRMDHLQGAENMHRRESAARHHRTQLLGVLFQASANAEDEKINTETLAQLVAWTIGDELVARVRTFASGLEREDAGVRAQEFDRIDTEIAELESQAQELRDRAAEIGYDLGAAA